MPDHKAFYYFLEIEPTRRDSQLGKSNSPESVQSIRSTTQDVVERLLKIEAFLGLADWHTILVL